MADLSFPLITAAIGIPAVAAVAAFTNNARARLAGVLGAAGASLCALEVFREVSAAGSARLAEPWSLGLFTADSLNATFLLLYSLLTLAILILAPRRDTSAKITGSTLLVLAATLTAYGADNLIVLAAAWILSALPAGGLGRVLSGSGWRHRPHRQRRPGRRRHEAFLDCLARRPQLRRPGGLRPAHRRHRLPQGHLSRPRLD
jgi:hypothetical protein